MNYSCVPIIVVCCYIVGEIYKLVFKKKTDMYKYIPLVLVVFGMIVAVCIYFTNVELIFNVTNLWDSMMIGAVSGASSTGTNQIIKQLFQKEEA